MFADGSAESYTTANLPNHLSTNIRGGYAVVYNRMAPGTDQHGSIVQRGWHVFPAIDNNFCEGLAVAEAIQLSVREIRVAIMCQGIRSNTEGVNRDALLTKGRPIIVKVFSDSQTFLKLVNKETLHFMHPSPAELRESGSSEHASPAKLQAPGSSEHASHVEPQASASSEHASHSELQVSGSSKHASHTEIQAPGSSEHAPSMSAGQLECNVKEQKHRLMEDLVELVIKGSEELQALPGDFEVDLELHWLPSHGASVPHDDRVRLHDYVDQIAAHCRKDRENLFQVDRRVLAPEPGVFASLKNPLLVPPPGFLALFHPAQQDLSVAGATDRISSVVDSVLLGRLQQLEEARQAPRLVQREHDVARKETLLDAREDRLAEGRQDLRDEKNAFSQAKNDLADEKKALDGGRKALGEGKKPWPRRRRCWPKRARNSARRNKVSWTGNGP